jgi:hypothetical protein
MTNEEKYKEALKRVAFMALKRKMLKDPPNLTNWVEKHDFTAAEVWEVLELVGDVALVALKDGE